MANQGKPRVAFFDFTCCEGCQLEVLALEERLLDVLQQVEVVQWREAMSEHSDEYDVAIVEGSISREEDILRIQRIRERAKILIALGSCATLGGVNAMKNQFDLDEAMQEVYGERASWFSTAEARPIHAVVPVDYFIHGCPINKEEFLIVLQHALLGKPYVVPNRAVCYECKFNETVCVYEKGKVCLGPITRCGCGAICTRFGHGCFGCRGVVEEPNLYAAKEVLTKYGYTVEDILERARLYNAYVAREELEGL
jgi:coenzyme F420-reducing hydrogenase gamma subunit